MNYEKLGKTENSTSLGIILNNIVSNPFQRLLINSLTAIKNHIVQNLTLSAPKQSTQQTNAPKLRQIQKRSVFRLSDGINSSFTAQEYVAEILKTTTITPPPVKPGGPVPGKGKGVGSNSSSNYLTSTIIYSAFLLHFFFVKMSLTYNY